MYKCFSGYVPDTDSEIGTLTLNSPQEWIDKSFHGHFQERADSVHKNLIEDYRGLNNTTVHYY